MSISLKTRGRRGRRARRQTTRLKNSKRLGQSHHQYRHYVTLRLPHPYATSPDLRHRLHAFRVGPGSKASNHPSLHDNTCERHQGRRRNRRQTAHSVSRMMSWLRTNILRTYIDAFPLSYTAYYSHSSWSIFALQFCICMVRSVHAWEVGVGGRSLSCN